jgi:hypothetical protein
MTDRLDEKIRAFVAELVNDPPATPEIDFEGVESPGVAALRQSPSRRRWVPVGVAAGAAFAVLVAVGLPVLFFGGGESVVVVEPSTTVQPTVTTVPPTTVAPFATTVPPVVPATPMTWDRVDDRVAFGGDGGQTMTDIAVRDGVAVAVGFDDADRDLDAAVWYTIDGVTWNRVPHDETVFGGDGHQRMNAVVALTSGFLAVGSEGDDKDPLRSNYPPSDSAATRAAVWRSDDGIGWTRVPDDDAFSDPDSGLVMNDVAFDGSGLVAVGGAFKQVETFATHRWDVWESEVPAPPSDVDIDVDAAVWTSADGIAWSRVTAGDEASGGDTIRQHMNAVVAAGPGFVAVGQEGFDYLGVDEWTPIEGNNTDGRDHVAENVAAVWTSPDGETWTRVVDEAALAHGGGAVTGWALMFDVVTSRSGLIAVGYDMWVQGSGVSPEWFESAAVWLSPDGLSWRRSGQEAFDNPPMRAVTATEGGGLVAGGGLVGWIEARIWSSHDGDTWVEHPRDETVLGGRPTSATEDEVIGPASIRGMSVYGSNVFAVGSFNGDAAVWVGTWN